LLIIASHGSGKMPRSVRADRGQKEVLQWRNDTPVALSQGCDLWSRWVKITNGVANVTKHDAGQLTIDEPLFSLALPAPYISEVK
jgi:hypothetical protein